MNGKCFFVMSLLAISASLSLVAEKISLNNLTDSQLIVTWIERDVREDLLGMPGSGYYPAGGIRQTEILRPQQQKNNVWINAKDNIFTLDGYNGVVEVVNEGSYTFAPSAQPDNGQTVYVLSPAGVVTLTKMDERMQRMMHYIG